MSDIDDGGPAFPESGLSGLPNDQFIHPQAGMTLRDYFAAKAMAVVATRHSSTHASFAQSTAQFAYELADHMLEARKK